MPLPVIRFPRFRNPYSRQPHPVTPLIQALMTLDLDNSDDKLKFNFLIKSFVDSMGNQSNIYDPPKDGKVKAADDFVPFMRMMFEDYAKKDPHAWSSSKDAITKLWNNYEEPKGAYGYAFVSAIGNLNDMFNEPELGSNALEEEKEKFQAYFKAQERSKKFPDIKRQHEKLREKCKNLNQGLHQGAVAFNEKHKDSDILEFDNSQLLMLQEAMAKVAEKHPELLKLSSKQQFELAKEVVAECDKLDFRQIDDFQNHIESHTAIKPYLNPTPSKVGQTESRAEPKPAAEATQQKTELLKQLLLAPNKHDKQIRGIMSELIADKKHDAVQAVIGDKSNFVKKRGHTNLLKNLSKAAEKKQSIAQDMFYQEVEKAVIREIEPIMREIFTECKNFNGVTQKQIDQAKINARDIYLKYKELLPEDRKDQLKQVNDYINQAVSPNDKPTTKHLNADASITYEAFNKKQEAKQLQDLSQQPRKRL